MVAVLVLVLLHLPPMAHRLRVALLSVVPRVVSDLLVTTMLLPANPTETSTPPTRDTTTLRLLLLTVLRDRVVQMLVNRDQVETSLPPIVTTPPTKDSLVVPLQPLPMDLLLRVVPTLVHSLD